MPDRDIQRLVERIDGGGGVPLIPTVSNIAASALGLSMMVLGHEQRVRKSRAVITHTHSEKPLTKRQKRRLRARITERTDDE